MNDEVGQVMVKESWRQELALRTVKSMLIVITMKKSERLVVANLSSLFLFGCFFFLF